MTPKHHSLPQGSLELRMRWCKTCRTTDVCTEFKLEQKWEGTLPQLANIFSAAGLRAEAQTDGKASRQR